METSEIPAILIDDSSPVTESVPGQSNVSTPIANKIEAQSPVANHRAGAIANHSMGEEQNVISSPKLLPQKLTGRKTNPKVKTSQVEKTGTAANNGSVTSLPVPKTKATNKGVISRKSGDNPISVYLDKNPGESLEPKKTGRGRGKVTQKETVSKLKSVTTRGGAKRSTSPLPLDPQCITPNRKQEVGHRKLGVTSCLSPAVSPGSVKAESVATSGRRSPRLQDSASVRQISTPTNSKQ